jgi:hypothetical protein
MRIALIGLAALLPALASADDASPAPYVLHQGRAVARSSVKPGGSRSNAVPVRPVSHSGAPVRTQVVGGRSSGFRSSSPAPAARAFRGSPSRRGITGSGPAPTPAPAPAPAETTPPPYAVPGAKIISAGQPPVYSEAAGGGTHSIEGGGFIAMDQAKAHDVGRAPGITWSPPDTPPSQTRRGTGGGSGASANGPAPTGGGNSNGPIINVNNGNTNGNQGGGGAQDNSTGFSPAF